MRHRGLTLVELCIGMAITGVIAAATATFASAVVTQWRDGNRTQMLNVSVQQARSILGPIIQSSRMIGGAFSSPMPALFLWQYDSLGGADQTPQLAEMSLIEYDAATQTIYYYQADQSKDLVDDETAMQVLTAADMQNMSVVTAFKTMSWLKPPRAILGPGRVIADAIEASRVSAATFQSLLSNGAQQLQWSATLTRGATTLNASDTLTLRAPSTIATGTP